MSFPIKDRPLKLVAYNPTAFTVPCIGHTFQGNFTAPCYDASILWRDYNDGSHGVRQVYGICMGRKEIYLWILYTSANRKDWNISGKGSCQVTQLQISLFSLSTPFLISSLKGDLQHDHFWWLSLYCTNTLFQYTQLGIIQNTHSSPELLPDGVQRPFSNRKQIN